MFDCVKKVKSAVKSQKVFFLSFFSLTETTRRASSENIQ